MANPERNPINLKEHIAYASIVSVSVVGVVGGIALINGGKVLSGIFAIASGLALNTTLFLYGLSKTPPKIS